MSVLGVLYKPEISKESHSAGSPNSASSNLHKTWQDDSTYTSAVCYNHTSVRQCHCNGELFSNTLPTGELHLTALLGKKNPETCIVLAGK